MNILTSADVLNGVVAAVLWACFLLAVIWGATNSAMARFCGSLGLFGMSLALVATVLAVESVAATRLASAVEVADSLRESASLLSEIVNENNERPEAIFTQYGSRIELSDKVLTAYREIAHERQQQNGRFGITNAGSAIE